MGVTTWPCPRCGQQQKQEAPNGEAVKVRLCAACQEKYDAEEKDVLLGTGSKAHKEKALDALDAEYKVTREKVESAETV